MGGGGGERVPLTVSGSGGESLARRSCSAVYECSASKAARWRFQHDPSSQADEKPMELADEKPIELGSKLAASWDEKGRGEGLSIAYRESQASRTWPQPRVHGQRVSPLVDTICHSCLTSRH